MAKQTPKDTSSKEKKLNTTTEEVLKSTDPIAIEQEVKDSYLNYAMSVIVSRALPDVRDGLKPVHRRILYAMHTLGMTHEKSFKKSATTVGEVLGKYHPHGDAAVYLTMVRMAQDFSLRYPLVDGQGNFGSIDGDPPAAMRYTESRMTELAEHMLIDIEKETVNFVPNFDDSRKEPSILPSGFPNLLVSGASGIAIGMATNMAPHNLREVTNAVSAYIDDENVSIEALMKYIPGPDFPTGGIIYGKEGIKKAYRTGRGQIKVRAKLDIETDKRGKEAIIITEIPYMLKKTDLIVKIAELVKTGKIEGVAALRDESDRRGMRIVIELKRGIMTQIVVNQLFKQTPLESTFGIINLALVDGVPRVLNLKELVGYFVKHRQEVVTRRTQYDLRKAEERAHIVEGLLIAQANIDEVIKIIRSSQNTEEARDRLIERFQLSDRQAQAILDMQLRRLTALEHEKLEKELAELKKLIAYFKDLLAHPKKILQVINKELLAITEKFGDDRRSEIIGKTDDIELDTDDLIHDEDVAISITHHGFIKRVLANSYRAQSRGGVGVNAGKLANDDFIEHLFVCSTKAYVFICTDKGKVFWLKAHEIPAMAKSAQGRSIKFILNLAPNESITSYFTVRDFDPDTTMMMLTRKGILKKLELKHLENAKKRGVLGLKLDNDDELVSVVMVEHDDDVILTTKNGQALRINESRVRPMGRAAAGVIGMRLADDDQCVSCNAIKKGHALMVITEKGVGKRLSPKRFNAKGRGGKGQIYMKIDAKTGNVASVKSCGPDDDVMVVTNEAMIIKMHANDISEMGRNAKGVRVVNLTSPAKVTDIATVPNEPAENE